jgi:diguanylate cyclase (GGDEF)-like protein
MLLRSLLILVEVLFITVLNYYMASSYYSLDVLYCLPVIQTARFAAIQSQSSSETFSLSFVAIICAVAWSAAEAAVTWPSFPTSAVLMNIITRGVTFTIIARVIVKLWKDRESARKDTLTGLANRFELTKNLEEMQLRSENTGSPYTLLFFDIELFKAFNHKFGLQSGDDVLKQLAFVLQEATKINDVVSRFISDEFYVLLPDMNEQLSHRVALRICGSAERKFKQRGWELTLSYGLVSNIGSHKTLEELIGLARENKNQKTQISSGVVLQS